MIKYPYDRLVEVILRELAGGLRVSAGSPRHRRPEQVAEIGIWR